MGSKIENTIERLNNESLNSYRNSEWYQARALSGMPQLLETRLALPSPENSQKTRLTTALEVIDLIENNTGMASTYPKEVEFQMHDAMRTAIFVNAVAFQEGNPNSKKARRKGANLEFDSQFVEEFATTALVDSPELTTEMIAALSYVESIKQFDRIGSQWKESVANSCRLDYSADIPAQRQLVELLNVPCNQEIGYDLSNVKDMLIKYLSNPNVEVQDILMHYRAPLADILTNIEAVRNLDIEGLLIKSATIINLISNRDTHDSRKAAYWANAQELLSFYAPMLEMAGFIKMSEQCYSAANEYLLQGEPEVLATAEKIYNHALVEWPELSEVLMLNFENLGIFTINGSRLKSLGSIANKLRNYQVGAMVPDVGAIMLTSKMNLRNMSDVKEALAAVIEVLEYNMGFEVANPNNEIPAIDIKWGDNPAVTDAIMEIYGREYVVNIQPKTIDSYEGINVSAITKLGTTVEVQIHDPRTAKARDGIASHFIYSIGKNGSGDLTTSRKNLKLLQQQLNQLRVEKPLSREVARFEKTYNLELKKFNLLKQQLLAIVSNTITPRVAELAHKKAKPRTNPKVIPLLIQESGISQEVKDLLNNPEIMNQINWDDSEP